MSNCRIRFERLAILLLVAASCFVCSAQNFNPEWSGTGFALKNGYIVTNFHVVDGAKTIMVNYIDNGVAKNYATSVVAVDRYHDLAIIRISDSRFTGFGSIPYAIRNQTADVGEDVWVLGYPLTQYLGNEIKLTTGVISSRSGYQGDISSYQISAPIQPGNSGGPLFDSSGNVVGIVNARMPDAENVGYAIKTTYLKSLVDNNNLSGILPSANSVSSLSLPEKVKKIDDFVFMLLCSSKSVSPRSSSSSSSSTPPSSSSESGSNNSASRLVVTPNSLVVDGNNGFVTINLNTDASNYSITLLPSWCTLVEKNKNWFKIAYKANPNSTSRKDWFNVKAGDKTVRVNITQKARSNASLSVSPNPIIVDGGKGSIMIDVKTDADDYTISLLPSWCTVIGKNKGWFKIAYTANPGSSSRSDWFNVKAGGNTVKVTITQKGGR